MKPTLTLLLLSLGAVAQTPPELQPIALPLDGSPAYSTNHPRADPQWLKDMAWHFRPRYTNIISFTGTLITNSLDLNIILTLHFDGTVTWRLEGTP